MTDALATTVIAQLMYLNSEDQKTPIELFINSPGGSVSAGLAIYDVMKHKVKAPIATVGMGFCASMGAFLLASGTKGYRYALPNTEIMIHQPSGGAEGTATDAYIQMRQLLKAKEKLNAMLAEMTGQELHKIQMDTERDNYMSAEEAIRYGIIDKIAVD